jgi:hypothetical protein
MAPRVHLSPELVDALEPPLLGERWVADADLRGFGVRLWGGKKGGGACYALRVRNKHGHIVRDSFSVWHGQSWDTQRKIRQMLEDGQFEFPLGLFLADAREWAIDRRRELKGRPTRAERRHELFHRASIAARQLTLAQMADRVFRKMEASGKNPDYVLQIKKLFWRLSEDVQASPLASISVRKLASEIADPNLPVMQSRALQSFVGQLYSRLYRWHAASGKVSDALNQRISKLRQKQRVPHPRILKISTSQYTRFIRLLRDDGANWREALALRLYFETGAKMRRVLCARWDQIIGDIWYPYCAEERAFWFVGREPLNDSAKETLQLARERLADEGRVSAYIFPRKEDVGNRPIATVRRYWTKAADCMGWGGLPMSHVVVRHRPRNTPSYLHMYTYMWVPISRQTVDQAAVSKFGKRLAAEDRPAANPSDDV